MSGYLSKIKEKLNLSKQEEETEKVIPIKELPIEEQYHWYCYDAKIQKKFVALMSEKYGEAKAREAVNEAYNSGKYQEAIMAKEGKIFTDYVISKLEENAKNN